MPTAIDTAGLHLRTGSSISRPLLSLPPAEACADDLPAALEDDAEADFEDDLEADLEDDAEPDFEEALEAEEDLEADLEGDCKLDCEPVDLLLRDDDSLPEEPRIERSSLFN